MMEIGKCYIVTEVTSMVYIGRVRAIVGPHTVILEDAAWMSESGSYLTNFLAEGRTDDMQIEIVGVRCVQWAGWGEWNHPLFEERV